MYLINKITIDMYLNVYMGYPEAKKMRGILNPTKFQNIADRRSRLTDKERRLI